MRRVPPVLAGGLAVLTAVLVACTDAETDEAGAGVDADHGPALADASEDEVAVSVYLRRGEDERATLEPVERTVALGADVAAAAVELLLDGPADDETSLRPVLPAGTELVGLEVSEGVATVTLSAAAVDAAEELGGSEHHELLALGALAHTLAQFPSVDRTRLEIDGVAPGRAAEFWGGWGLPEVLVADPSVTGGATPASLAAFSTRPQRVGHAGGRDVVVTDVTARRRLGYDRVVVELGDVAGAEEVAVPQTVARHDGEDLVVRLVGVDVADPDAVGGDEFTRPPRLTATDAGARVELPGAADRKFHLHTLAGPTRLVLDVHHSSGGR